MNLEYVRLGVDGKGFASVIGYLRGKASDTRAKWEIGFGAANHEGKVVFLVHAGLPTRPLIIVSAEEGIEFLEACMEKKFYKAITMVDWEPEQVSETGWMTAFTLNPLHVEVVYVSPLLAGPFERIIELLRGE